MSSKTSLTPSKSTLVKNKKLNSEQELRNQCIKILTKTPIEQIQQWLKQHKITSYSLRNDKTMYVINTSINIITKIMLNPDDTQQYPFLRYLFAQLKLAAKKQEFCKLLRYLAKRDYQFEYIASVASSFYIGKQDNISLYLKVRNQVINGFLNKGKKELLGTVHAQIQQWFAVAQKIFKPQPEQIILAKFSDKVKEHYTQFKKDQNANLAGSDFLKICLSMSAQRNQQADYVAEVLGNRSQHSNQKYGKINEIVHQTALSGLQQDDKQLIRALSYKDNNIARILQEKHNKMLRLIAQDVQQLRKNIKQQKQKHIQIVEQKQSLVKKIQTIKNCVLEYIGSQHSQKSQQKLLNILQIVGKQVYLNTQDVEDMKKKAKNRRLIEIIQAEQKL